MTNSYTVNERGQLNNFAVEPKMYVDENVNTGFTKYAERGGRFAMIGFVSLIATEVLTGQGLIGWLTSL